jgi:thiamine-phosphate pyrophosphorylase
MARCYSDRMPPRQSPLPRIWLVSDRRNDARLATVLARLPRGSGLIFRHYHLDPAPRRARFAALSRIARARGHQVILAGPPRLARRWGADGSYGAPVPGRTLATVHSLREIGRARRLGAAAVLLSPVFATRSHPGAAPLGPQRFRALARRAGLPVIALGGMDARRARALGAPRFAAIDGLPA